MHILHQDVRIKFAETITDRNVLTVLFIALIFVFAIGYTVFSATTISTNISTDGTLSVSGGSTVAALTASGTLNASSTLQATGNVIAYASIAVNGTTTPGTPLSVVGAGVFTGHVAAKIFFATSTGEASIFPIASSTSFSVADRLTVAGAGTSTFTGPISAGLLSSGSGFAITGGSFHSSVALNITSAGASNFPAASTTSFSAANLITVSGAGTSTVTGGVTVGGITTTNGLAVTSGRLNANGVGVLAGTLGVGTTSPAQELGVTGDIQAGSAATTTVSAESTSATQGGCIELKSADGTFWARIYAGRGQNATSTTGVNASAVVVIEPGRCQ